MLRAVLLNRPLAPLSRTVPAHHELYEKAGILHRDVSVENLMVDATDHRCGILIDLDIAARVQDGDQTLHPILTHAGTLGFRSIELLRQSTHYPTRALYEDDLESFFYALYHVQTLYHDGRRLPIHDKKRWWHTISPDRIGLLAARKLMDLREPIPDCPLGEWLAGLQKLLASVHLPRDDEEVHLTYRAFMDRCVD